MKVLSLASPPGRQFAVVASVCSEPLGGEGELAEGWVWGQADFPEGRVPGRTGQVGGAARGLVPTSRRETSMSTAELAAWLHRQATWVRFRDSSSQHLADQPPVPPELQRKRG